MPNDLKYQITGTPLPVVTIQLMPGQALFSEAGGMSWMSSNIAMNTNTDRKSVV